MCDISFVCFGDWGSGTADQTKVAQTISRYYQNNPFQFVCGLGDNFYPHGITKHNYLTTVKRLFSEMYRNIPVPFYMVLGNHDHLGDPFLQCDLTNLDHRWKLPNPYYQFQIKSPHQCVIQFIALDSELLQKKTKESEQQFQWIERQLKKTRHRVHWTFILAHHPLVSSGCHGNAGPYYTKNLNRLLSKYPIDAILSGHDHDKQIIKLPSGAHQIIVGTGGYVRSCPRPAHGCSDQVFFKESLGFAAVNITKYIMELHLIAPLPSNELTGDGRYHTEYSYMVEPRSEYILRER